MKRISLKSIVSIICYVIISLDSYGQNSNLYIPKNTRLPKDTVLTNKLINSLRGFLDAKNNPNSENQYILPQQFLETSTLLDELKEVEKSMKYENDNFYRCHLQNITKIDSKKYVIQLYYIGAHNNTPVLSANYSIIAQENEDRFYFYSPLRRNTSTWITKRIKKNIFHYKKDFPVSEINNYISKIATYDSILNLSSRPIELYYTDNFHEALKLLGVDYKVDYNGYRLNSLSSYQDSKQLIVDGILSSQSGKFDPHDLWHSRSRLKIPAHKIHKAVDEGCAFLYGGSWGYSWEEILQRFKRFIVKNPNADWLTLYNEQTNYGDEKGKALRVNYTINALLVKKIVREQGFEAILKMLGCGKYQENNENYFAALKEVTGITKDNFNHNISELVSQIE